jgi:hypothetical protein
MWPFKKKPKIYCDECEFYDYKRKGNDTKWDRPFQCYSKEGTKIKRIKRGTAISKPRHETETLSYEDAWEKNRDNNCDDFKAKWFDLEKITNETS